MSLVTVVTVYGEGETETESAYPYLRSNVYAVKKHCTTYAHSTVCTSKLLYIYTEYGISNI